MKRLNLKAKSKGGALLYSLFIVTIVGVLTSIVISISYFSNVNFIQFKQKSSVLRNAASGLNLLLSADPGVDSNKEKTLDLYGDGIDSVTLKRLNWGFFEVVSSKAFNKNKIATKVALIGEQFDDETALYLADRNKPLSLAGKTEIKGKCYLPEKGVKRAYIEGTTYQGDKLIYGAIQTSEKTLPKLNSEIISAMKNRSGDVSLESDSMVVYELLEDSIKQTFHEKTILAYSSSVIVIDNKIFSGNLIIKSSKGIIVSSNTRLENVLLYAPFIEIRDNFSGSLQAFVTDSLLVGKNVGLEYPSALGLFQQNKGEESHFIAIGEESIIDGAIICFQENFDYRNPVKVTVEQIASVKGFLYANGLVELKGSMLGSLYCNRFSLKTPSTVYENHLLNAKIDVEGRPELYVGPKLMEEKPGKKEIIQWLN